MLQEHGLSIRKKVLLRVYALGSAVFLNFRRVMPGIFNSGREACRASIK